MTRKYEYGGESKTYFLEERILTICEVSDGLIALGLPSWLVVFEVAKGAVVSKVRLHCGSFREFLRWLGCYVECSSPWKSLEWSAWLQRA